MAEKSDFFKNPITWFTTGVTALVLGAAAYMGLYKPEANTNGLTNSATTEILNYPVNPNNPNASLLELGPKIADRFIKMKEEYMPFSQPARGCIVDTNRDSPNYLKAMAVLDTKLVPNGLDGAINYARYGVSTDINLGRGYRSISETFMQEVMGGVSTAVRYNRQLIQPGNTGQFANLEGIFSVASVSPTTNITFNPRTGDCVDVATGKHYSVGIGNNASVESRYYNIIDDILRRPWDINVFGRPVGQQSTSPTHVDQTQNLMIGRSLRTALHVAQS